MISPHAFPELERFYTDRLARLNQSAPVTGKKTKDTSTNIAENKQRNDDPNGNDPTDERLLLEMESGKELGKILETPAIAIEVERAVLQVGQKLKSAKEESSERKNQ